MTYDDPSILRISLVALDLKKKKKKKEEICDIEIEQMNEWAPC